MRVNRLGVRMLAVASAAAFLVGTAAPALAQPGVEVPDGGARPLGESPDDTPVTNPETADGPLADQINALGIEVAQLAEETTATEAEWRDRDERLAGATTVWIESIEVRDTAQGVLDDAAGAAYADLAGVPDTELPDLTGLNPLGGEWDLPALTESAAAAATAESVAHAAYDTAAESAARSEDRYHALAGELADAQDELDDLVERNAEELQRLEQEREAAAQRYSDDFSSEVDGWDAAPEAKRAVEYALSQLGKPYEWGAEGPHTFDCSGLTQSAYAYAGVTIPRVAADQFNATRDEPVDTELLLPGDLLFWWDSPGDWRSVYHVGMYLGDGKMVQAPRTGDVVKISGIWLDNFAGAHRVVDAVRTDPDADDDPTGGGPTEEPTGDPEPSPTPGEPVDPGPSPSPSPDEPSPSGGDDTGGPSDSTSGREPEPTDPSGGLSEGGYGRTPGDGTMVTRLPD